MRKYLPAIAAAVLVSGIALAGAIKSWSSSETITASDLNSNFTHVHTAAEANISSSRIADGTIVNADISSSAAIDHSKLATPALVPKAYASLGAACTGASAAGTACGSAESSYLTLQSDGSTGRYRGVLSYTPANTNFAVMVTVNDNSSSARCSVYSRAVTSPHFIVICRDNAEAAVDGAISVVVYDQ